MVRRTGKLATWSGTPGVDPSRLSRLGRRGPGRADAVAEVRRRILDECRSAPAASGFRLLLLWATEDGRPLHEREDFTTSDRLLHLGVPD